MSIATNKQTRHCQSTQKEAFQFRLRAKINRYHSFDLRFPAVPPTAISPWTLIDLSLLHQYSIQGKIKRWDATYLTHKTKTKNQQPLTFHTDCRKVSRDLFSGYPILFRQMRIQQRSYNPGGRPVGFRLFLLQPLVGDGRGDEASNLTFFIAQESCCGRTLGQAPQEKRETTINTE